MWARVVEIMLGFWLWTSPFVFGHIDRSRLAGADFAAGALVIVLGLLSFHQPTRRAYLGTIVVAGALCGWGYAAFPHPPPPGAQNHLLVGLTLLVFAIVPVDASRPPRAWRDYLEGREPAGEDVSARPSGSDSERRDTAREEA